MEVLYILRHGQAHDLEDGKFNNDFERNLTDEGKEKIKSLSLFFNKLDEEVEIVLSSPFIRAKETAEIFTNKLTSKPPLKIVDFLSCGVSPKEIINGLIPYFSYKKIIIVGHAPDLELFLGKIVGANRITLKKGALAKVLLTNNIELYGELIWLITPKLINGFKLK